jgi:hypothetical protein
MSVIGQLQEAEVPLLSPATSEIVDVFSDPYMGRTAQLTSRRCILNTYSTNIRTEYFKRAA